MYDVRCTMYDVRLHLYPVLYIMYYLQLYFVPCTLYSVLKVLSHLYSVLYTMYSRNCTLYSGSCTLYSVIQLCSLARARSDLSLYVCHLLLMLGGGRGHGKHHLVPGARDQGSLYRYRYCTLRCKALYALYCIVMY